MGLGRVLVIALLALGSTGFGLGLGSGGLGSGPWLRGRHWPVRLRVRERIPQASRRRGARSMPRWPVTLPPSPKIKK